MELYTMSFIKHVKNIGATNDILSRAYFEMK